MSSKIAKHVQKLGWMVIKTLLEKNGKLAVGHLKPHTCVRRLSVRTYVCGLRHTTADLRQRFFPFFSFMFGCLNVSDSDLRQRFFRSGREKNQMTSEFRCLQNIEKFGKNSPSQIGRWML